MDNNQLEKNFWKAGQTPLSATNLNLMTNAIIDNAEAISEGLSTIPEKTIKIVDKLPETNIESNVIYGVETGLRCEAYTYFYGLKVPVLKFENLEENYAKLEEKFAEIAEEKNLTENDFQLLAGALTSGYVPIEIDFNTAIIMNYFDSNSEKYIFNVSNLYKKEFNNINELSNYLLSGQYAQDMIDHNEGDGALETVSLLNRLGMKYSNEELTNDDIGVSYILHPDHYEYYIYNNKEWKSLNGIETVDSLPTENIKVNTIYSLKKTNYEGYFYILGTKIPEITKENADSSMETVNTKLSNQGFSSEEIDKIMTALSCSLIPINIPEYGLINVFDKDSQKYICRYPEGNIHKEFNTIKEMENYFVMGQFVSDLRTAGVGESTINGVASGIELLKSRLEFNYTNSAPVTISAVVYEEKPEDTSYNYFIYDGEKWIELGKGGVPSISITISDIGPAYENPITDEDLKTIINNDVVVANVSFSEEGRELSFKLFKTASVKIGDSNEIVMSTITNVSGSTVRGASYLNLIVNLTTKTYTVDFEDFPSTITNSNNAIYLLSSLREPTGSSVYIYTINGENIVGKYDNNITTSIKLENKIVNNWISDSTYSDYPYRATISESTITSDMVAEVIYGLTEVKSGNYAPICETFNGGIYIYSKVNTTITIPTILVVK